MAILVVPLLPPGGAKFREMERVWSEVSSVEIRFSTPKEDFQIDLWVDFIRSHPATGIGSAILEFIAEHPGLLVGQQIRIFKIGDIGVRVALVLRADVSRAVLYSALRSGELEVIDHALINPVLDLECLVWAYRRSSGSTRGKILAEYGRRAGIARMDGASQSDS